MQLIRRPRGSSTAAPFTKPSTKWLMVVPIVPPCRYSSVRTPDTNVNDPLSAMKGSAARTRLIWPIPLNLIEFAPCSSVLSSRAPKDTSPAALTLGMGNVRLVVAGLAADRDDLVSVLLQCSPYGGSDSSASNDDCFHLVSPVRF